MLRRWALLFAGVASALAQKLFIINTPDDFFSALDEDATAVHIVLEGHLDLRGRPAAPGATEGEILRMKSSLKSIRGACVGDASLTVDPPPLYSRKPGQCVIISDASMFKFAEEDSRVWIDNIFFRGVHSSLLDITGEEIFVRAVALIAPGTQIWMTNVTMQGDLSRGDGIFHDQQTKSHMEDMVFVHLLDDYGPAIGGNGQISCKNCLLAHNVARVNGTIDLWQSPATVRLENCTFVNNTGINLRRSLFAPDAPMYSDVQRPVLDDESQTLMTSTPLSDIPIQDPPIFISLQSPDFTAIQSEANELEERGRGNDNNESVVTGAVVGSIAGALLMAGVAAAFVFSKRRMKLKAVSQPVKVQPEGSNALGNIAVAADTMPAQSTESVFNLGNTMFQDTAMYESYRCAVNQEELTVAYQNIGLAKPINASDPQEVLSVYLDRMYESRERFAGEFILHGFMERRVGGQGVVQFAHTADGTPVVIKFFNDAGSFNREKQLYCHPALMAMLPSIITSNGDGTVKSSAGFTFPPYIIVERGESLDEWASRCAPDFPTSVCVLCHVAGRLVQMHDAGLAHHDLKPPNILWRPRANAWTLIDFGCTAEIGSRIPLMFTLQYAPPEFVHAVELRQASVAAAGAADVWAIGVIAFELLTGTPAFAPGTRAELIMDTLAGRAQLPWERDTAPRRLLPRLQALERSVLSCLQRDAALRPSAQALLGAWTGLFESVTGTTVAQHHDAVVAAQLEGAQQGRVGPGHDEPAVVDLPCAQLTPQALNAGLKSNEPAILAAQQAG